MAGKCDSHLNLVACSVSLALFRVIMESDPTAVVNRVAIRAEDSNLGATDQTVAQVGLSVIA